MYHTPPRLPQTVDEQFGAWEPDGHSKMEYFVGGSRGLQVCEVIVRCKESWEGLEEM